MGNGSYPFASAYAKKTHQLGTAGPLLTKILRTPMQTNEIYSLYLLLFFIIIG